jgi:group I intron endonuclease
VGEAMQVIDKTYVVYRHIFPNGKCYIGITCAKPYSLRWQSGRGYRKQQKIYNAIKKYGWENVQHEVLAFNLDLNDANRVEQELIEKYNSIDNGYNISTGGGGCPGFHHSSETKLKISKATRGKPHGKGNPSALKRYVLEHGAWNKGKKLSVQHRQKVATVHRARLNKPITAYDPITMIAALHFDCGSDAAKAVGVSPETIYRCAKGGRKTSAGYVWRYDDASV